MQIRRGGGLGLQERGTRADVPAELVPLAAALFDGSVTRCVFHWFGSRDLPACRVSLERGRDGGFEYVALSGDPVDELPHRLSARELEVLTLLVAGVGNSEIATALWITERTAATHVNHIMRKLAVPSRTAAATQALDAGLLHVPLPGRAETYDNLAVTRLLSGRDPSASGRGRRAAPGRPRDLVVGAIVPSTGTGSDDGMEMLNGLQLALEEINAAGGVRGRQVRRIAIDVDVNSADSVRSAFDRLLQQGVDVLTSGYLAAQDVAHEIAADSGVPYLHAATSGVMERAVQRDITRFDRVFQMCASDTTYAPAFVSYLTSLRDRGLWDGASNRLVVLQKGWQHVDFGVSEAALAAERAGWQLDCVPVTGSEDGDGWQRAVQQATKDPAAAVMIGSFLVDDAVQAVEAIHASSPSTLPYAIYAPSVPAFRQRLGDAAEGVLWATMTGTYSDTNGVAFARRYEERFGVTPGRSHAGIAYDRMHRIALAWRLADDLADGGVVAEHLRHPAYRGVNGTYNFNTPGQAADGFAGDDGDPSLAQPQLIYQIQNGSQVIVSGGPFRTGDFRRTDHGVATR